MPPSWSPGRVISRSVMPSIRRSPPGWCGAWFSMFPIHDWSYYLLAIAYATVGLWMAWRLYGRYLDAEKRIVALACLTLLALLQFSRHAVRSQRGARPAVGGDRALLHPLVRNAQRRAGRRSPAPPPPPRCSANTGRSFCSPALRVAALASIRAVRSISARPRRGSPSAVGALLLAPHIVWLVQHDFMPLTYAVGAHSVKTFTDTFGHGGPLSRRRARLRGGAGAGRAVADPAERCAALADIHAAARARAAVRRRGVSGRRCCCRPWSGRVLDVDLNPIWTMPGLILLPVILLSSPMLAISRQAVTAIIALAVALPLALLAASPVIAIAIHKAGPDPVSAHAQLLAARVEAGMAIASTRRPLARSSAAISAWRTRRPSTSRSIRRPIRCWSRKPSRGSRLRYCARRRGDGVQPRQGGTRLHVSHRAGDRQGDCRQPAAAPRRGHAHAHVLGHSGQAGAAS